MFLMIWKFSLRLARRIKEPLQGVLHVSGFRVIYNPIALIKALEKYQMQKRIDTIHAQQGPIDGVIGSFNPSNGDIMVDFKEIILMLSPKGSDEIDKQLTKTLAHELRHRWQFNNHGTLSLYWDKFVILGVMNFIFWKLITLDLWKYAWDGVSGDGFFSGVIVGIIALVVSLVGLVISGIFSYYFSWIERDARRFAENAVQDPVWQEIFEVHE